MGTIGGIVRYGRPDDYVFKRKAEIEGADAGAGEGRGATTLDPNAMTWVVVGDLKQIEAPVRALNLGEVSIVDADGKPAWRRAREVIRRRHPPEACRIARAGFAFSGAAHAPGPCGVFSRLAPRSPEADDVPPARPAVRALALALRVALSAALTAPLLAARPRPVGQRRQSRSSTTSSPCPTACG